MKLIKHERFKLTFLIGILFVITQGVSAALIVKEPVVLNMDQNWINSQLRDAFREDIKFGNINVYDGSKWVNGPVSLHIDKIDAAISSTGVKISIVETLTSPFGKKPMTIDANFGLTEFQTSIDIEGFCNTVLNVGKAVSVVGDLVTDKYSGSKTSPDYLLRKYFSNFKFLKNFSQYTKAKAIEKCWPASFTGKIDFGLLLKEKAVQMTVTPELEYLELKATPTGSISKGILTLNFVSNFPLLFRINGDVAYKDAYGRSFNTNLSITSSEWTTDGNQWKTTASGKYDGPNNGSFPDLVFDLESPCGELVQHNKMLVMAPAVGFTLNSQVFLP